MVDLNTLLAAVLAAEAALTSAEMDVSEAEDRRRVAADALAREQAVFDCAVVEARALARPSAAAVMTKPGFSSLAQDAVEPEEPLPAPCSECGQPAPIGHVCRRMEGAPGPLPAMSPAHSEFAGTMPAAGFAPEPDDDREDNTGE